MFYASTSKNATPSTTANRGHQRPKNVITSHNVKSTSLMPQSRKKSGHVISSKNYCFGSLLGNVNGPQIQEEEIENGLAQLSLMKRQLKQDLCKGRD